MMSFFGRQPDRGRLLASDHQIYVVLGPQTMRHRRQEAVRIRREVDSGEFGFKVKDGADE